MLITFFSQKIYNSVHKVQSKQTGYRGSIGNSSKIPKKFETGELHMSFNVLAKTNMIRKPGLEKLLPGFDVMALTKYPHLQPKKKGTTPTPKSGFLVSTIYMKRKPKDIMGKSGSRNHNC